MSQHEGLDRRSFLRNAGLGALAGAVATGTSFGSVEAAASPFAVAGPDGKYDFDTPYNRFGTDSVKWDSPAAQYGGRENIVAGMGIADMDFKAAPAIAKAISDRAAHENWGYMAIPKSFTEAIVNYNKRRYNLAIDPETVVLTTGVHSGLIAALETFAPAGTGILMVTPIYNGFYGDIRYTHTVAEESLMKKVDGRYSIDWDDFEKRAGRSNVMIWCNPQNPTGNVWSQEDMLRAGEICLKHKVVVLSDEIHCDFMTKGQKYTPWANLPNKAVVDNSLTFKSATKSFSIPGMKAAWYFTTNPDYLARVKSRTRADLSTLGVLVSRAVLNDGEDWLNQCIDYIDGNHEYTAKFVNANMAPLVTCVKAHGTYLSWLDVSGLMQKINAQQQADEETARTGKVVTPDVIVERWFVQHAKVYLEGGHSFGKGGGDHMRMNIATSRKTLELAYNNMAKALHSNVTSTAMR